MPDPSLRILLNLELLNLKRIEVTEGDDKYLLDDTFVLEDKNGLIQMMFNNSNTIELRKLGGVSDLVLWDTFSGNLEVNLLQAVLVENNKPVKQVLTYSQRGIYFFGMKCLDQDKNFIVGFCFGWDEMISLNEHEFEAMVQQYVANKNVEVVKTVFEN